MRIFTKMGDKGETSLFDGRRVAKDHTLMDVLGGLDELQSFVGLCRAGVAGTVNEGAAADGVVGGTFPTPTAVPSVGAAGTAGTSSDRSHRKLESPIKSDERMQFLEVLLKIQDDLYRIMGICGFEMKCPPSIKALAEEDVEFLEKAMEKHEKAINGLREFIRPGSSEAAARFHVARSVCRRVERDIVRICGDVDVPPLILKYINRLSDLLFVFGYLLEKR
ncbi:ATP:cob(I)alamin adenosyltransferase [Candidatus Peregrinibacteria bacterium]|nr:ATP:cob(I)alamin adenosyltransferase [Candidatus Peregrinibacteria bacterium]